jgi:hypothetical protein
MPCRHQLAVRRLIAQVSGPPLLIHELCRPFLQKGVARRQHCIRARRRLQLHYVEPDGLIVRKLDGSACDEQIVAQLGAQVCKRAAELTSRPLSVTASKSSAASASRLCA